MTDPNTLLTGARLPEDEVSICTRPDLAGEWQQLAQAVAARKLKSAADPRLAGDGTDEQVQRMETLREQVEAATVVFRLRALRRKVWLDLVETHPARQSDEEDARMGVNRESFLPALVRASTVAPELTDETWAALLDPDGELLTVHQWRQLWRTCWNLNVQQVDLPFSVAGLLPNPNCGGESGSPEPSA
ncbi:hypothetical protein [Micromonospora inyonensis]|uniref:DUF2017 domain-containing protein n=1 Tax=Micromonospora inyonensis TaxID=47866 RepID=A0A1C6RX51_9ACTN|nr:hypothetical protein [Micromonospora inyonensis]SCL21715.1 hypothetical protein GA0074694_3122 [Micromonospora inyonensis]